MPSLRLAFTLIAAALVSLALPSGAHAQSADWKVCADSSADPNAGIEACTRIIRSGNESKRNLAIAHYNRGNAYRKKRDFETAIDEYTASLRTDPEYTSPYNNRGLS